MPSIAIIGDIHFHFSTDDITYFNASNYDLLLFVGDLGEFDPKEDLTVAKRLSCLTKPAIFIPGNHDVANYFNVVAEALDWGWLEWFSSFGRPANVTKLAETLHPVICGGYSNHSFSIAQTDFDFDFDFDVVVARPFSMGGSRVSFPQLIKRLHRVSSLQESIARLKSCVDQTQSNNLIFLAHNGPFGCGDQPTDPWGVDFGQLGNDFGEPDLAAAIDYAASQGKQVIAVIAGHMHHLTKQGAQRTWHLTQNLIQNQNLNQGQHQTHFINAACVPRIFAQNGQEVRHHIRLQFGEQSIECTEILAT